MLYASTRGKNETYTAYRTYMEDRAPDGGFFIPFRMASFSANEMEKILQQPFPDIVAYVLNYFFGSDITGWDIECAVGKCPFQLVSMPHRVILGKLWNNLAGDYRYICNKIYERLSGQKAVKTVPEWAGIVIRISVMFGLVAAIRKDGVDCVDISVNVGDFSDPMAAWYAKKLGLPIGTIVCACNDNSGAWDILHRGELNPGTVTVKSVTPALDYSNPPGLERLICASFGHAESQRYVKLSKEKKLYQLRPDMTEIIGDGFYVSVVGRNRVEAVINSVYRANQCLLDPYAAVSYGSLQDYRAKTGEGNPTLLLWDHSPLSELAVVKNATGLNNEQIQEIIHQI